MPDSDCNCFHDLEHDWLANQAWRDVAGVCQEHGIECHSITGDPGFADHVHYHIHTDSPCYHAGENGATIGYFTPEDGGMMSVIEYLRTEAMLLREAADSVDLIADALVVIDVQAQAAVREAEEALVAVKVVEEGL